MEHAFGLEEPQTPGHASSLSIVPSAGGVHGGGGGGAGAGGFLVTRGNLEQWVDYGIRVQLCSAKAAAEALAAASMEAGKVR